MLAKEWMTTMALHKRGIYFSFIEQRSMWEYRYFSDFFGPFLFRTSYLFNLESSTAVVSPSIWRRFDEGRFMDDAPLFLQTVDAISL